MIGHGANRMPTGCGGKFPLTREGESTLDTKYPYSKYRLIILRLYNNILYYYYTNIYYSMYLYYNNNIIIIIIQKYSCIIIVLVNSASLWLF